MTWGQYLLYADGYSIREAREWERARYICTTVLNSVGSKVNPTELFELRTDQVQEVEKRAPLTRAEFEALIKTPIWATA